MKVFSDPAAKTMRAEPLQLGLLVCLQILSVPCRSWRPVRLEWRKGSKVMQRNCSTSSRVICSRPCWVSSFYTSELPQQRNTTIRCLCSGHGAVFMFSSEQVWSWTRTWFRCLSSDLIMQTKACWTGPYSDNVNESTDLSVYTDKNLSNLRCQYDHFTTCLWLPVPKYSVWRELQ